MSILRYFSKKDSEVSISDPEFDIAISLVEVQQMRIPVLLNLIQKCGAKKELTVLNNDLISESLKLSTAIPKPLLNTALSSIEN